VKALIADDHNLIREGIKLILNRLRKSVDILEADNFDDARKIVAANVDLDLIIMDLFMPGMMGPQGVSIIRNSAPVVPVIVLSMSEDPEHMRDSLKFGANGYVSKTSKNSILSNAINLVLEGGIYIPPEMLGAITDTGRYFTAADNNSKKPSLTDRQMEVLKLMAQGRTNKDIARLLDISDTTVKSHITTIFRQLDANNRTQAVHYAQQFKLINNDRPDDA
jgi:DNA-binding NarL/FixJ family response regulator